MKTSTDPFLRKPIEIPFNRNTLIRLVLINSLIFSIFLGLYIYARFNNTVVLFFLPILIFLGLNFFFYVNKLIVGKPAFIINSKGIWDNSMGSSVGWIEWEQIDGIDYCKPNYNALSIMVRHPRLIVSRAQNILQKVGLWINWKCTGSPIVIYSNLTELRRISLRHEIEIRYRQNKSASFDDFSEHLVDE